MHLVHLRSTLRTPAVTLQPGRNAPAMEKVPAPRQTNQLLPGLEIGEAHCALRPAAANDRSPARFEHDVGGAEGRGEPLGDGSAGGGWLRIHASSSRSAAGHGAEAGAARGYVSRDSRERETTRGVHLSGRSVYPRPHSPMVMSGPGQRRLVRVRRVDAWRGDFANRIPTRRARRHPPGGPNRRPGRRCASRPAVRARGRHRRRRGRRDRRRRGRAGGNRASTASARAPRAGMPTTVRPTSESNRRRLGTADGRRRTRGDADAARRTRSSAPPRARGRAGTSARAFPREAHNVDRDVASTRCDARGPARATFPFRSDAR